MDRTTQQFSRGFTASYGDFGSLTHLDKIAQTLDEKTKENIRKILSRTNSLCAAIEYNCEERKFKRWCLDNMKREMFEFLDSKFQADHPVYTTIKNFIVTKYRTIHNPIGMRPKGLTNEQWHDINHSKREVGDEAN